jgi:hypothetical protein
MGWLSGWAYRKSHIINPATGAGTGYQIPITAHYVGGTDSGADVYLNGHPRTDFGDVRFTASDGTTLLDYWMQEVSSGNYAKFWVEVAADLSSSSATIYIYYGNPSATTTSNGANTFLFFEDFEVNLSAWTITTYGSASIDRSTDYAFKGSYSGKDTDATNSYAYAQRTFTAKDLGAVMVWFYDNGSAKQQVAAVDDGSTLIFIGRWEPQSSSYYVYRIGETWYTSSVPVSTGWHKFEFIYGSGSNVILKIDDTQIYSGTPLASYSRMMFGDMWYGYSGDPNAPGYYDCWAERKYVSPEPSNGVWGAEEPSGVNNYPYLYVLKGESGEYLPQVTPPT